jgi:hypothetical protein
MSKSISREVILQTLENNQEKIKEDFDLDNYLDVFKNGGHYRTLCKILKYSKLDRVATFLRFKKTVKDGMSDIDDFIDIFKRGVEKVNSSKMKTNLRMGPKILQSITSEEYDAMLKVEQSLFEAYRHNILGPYLNMAFTSYNIEVIEIFFDVSIRELNSLPSKTSIFPILDVSSEIMSLPEVFSKTKVSITYLMEQFYGIVDRYFADGDDERSRMPKFKKWCQIFLDNDYNFKGAIAIIDGAVKIVGYVDVYLVSNDFYNDWKKGDCDISDLILRHEIGPKYLLNKSDEYHILIETLVIDSRAFIVDPQKRQKYVLTFIKHIEDVVEMFVKRGYRLKYKLAHGYTVDGAGFLDKLGYSKVARHTYVKDDYRMDTHLYQKLIS